jgi:hypothetical protein
MQLAFGPGAIWGIPNIANPTPIRMALAKSSALSFNGQVKAAQGAGVYAKALGRGAVAVKGTLEMEALSLRTLSDLFLNGGAASGEINIALDETGTVPASSPYTVQVVNHATFVRDLGVKYAATGQPLICVASAPAQGQYSFSAGTYTFASADSGVAVRTSYEYTTASSGETVTLSNYMQGCPNPFTAVLMRSYQSSQEIVTLNNVLADSYDDTAGQDAFAMPKLTFQAATDSSDTLGTISMAEYM